MITSILSQQKALEAHCEKAVEKIKKKLCFQLQVYFYMAKNYVASIRDWLLLGPVKAPDIGTPDGIYWHSDSLDDMEQALESVMKKLNEKLKGSDIIGVITDETVIITVDKKLVN